LEAYMLKFHAYRVAISRIGKHKSISGLVNTYML
jgi:hypothetical protein